MSSPENKFYTIILLINKWVVKVLMLILTICLILALGGLSKVVYNRIVSPPLLIIDVVLLFEIFNLVLIIAVGYELIKSLSIIVSSNRIPTRPIIQIALIAVANKVITLDLKNTTSEFLYGLAAVLIALGITYFFLNNAKQKEEADFD